jgi:hypothetical protein
VGAIVGGLRGLSEGQFGMCMLVEMRCRRRDLRTLFDGTRLNILVKRYIYDTIPITNLSYLSLSHHMPSSLSRSPCFQNFRQNPSKLHSRPLQELSYMAQSRQKAQLHRHTQSRRHQRRLWHPPLPCEDIHHAVLQVTKHIARGLYKLVSMNVSEYSCTVVISANKSRDELLWKNGFPWDREGDL